MPQPSLRRPVVRRSGVALGTAVALLALAAPSASAAAPANDQIANAKDLTSFLPAVGVVHSELGHTNANGEVATRESGEPWVYAVNEGGGAGTAPGSVWYRFTAPRTTRARITTCGGQTSYATAFAVYRASTGTSDFSRLWALGRYQPGGDPCPTSPTASNGRGASALVSLQAGETYYVQVTGRHHMSPSNQGRFELTVEAEDAPSLTVEGPDGGAVLPTASLAWSVAAPGASRLRCTIDGTGLWLACLNGPTPGAWDVVSPTVCSGAHVMRFVALGAFGSPSRPTERSVVAGDGPVCAAPDPTTAALESPGGPGGLRLRWSGTPGMSATPHRGLLELGTTPGAYTEAVDVLRDFGDTSTRYLPTVPLSADTDYYYRWTVTTPAGSDSVVGGPVRTASAAADTTVAETAAATGITTTSAALAGVAHRAGAFYEITTSYRFDVREQGGSAVPTAPAGVWGGGVVSLDLDDLKPGTTYEYRLLATTNGPRAASQWRTFSTAAAPVTPDPEPTPTPDPTPVGPAVAPGGGPVGPGPVLPAGPAALTPATVGADLRSALQATERALSRRTLRTARTVTVAVKARTAGQLTITGTVKRGTGKAVAAIRGTARVAKPGTVKVRLKVLPAGQKAARAKGTLTLSLKAVLKPRSGRAVTATRSGRLKG